MRDLVGLKDKRMGKNRKMGVKLTQNLVNERLYTWGLNREERIRKKGSGRDGAETLQRLLRMYIGVFVLVFSSSHFSSLIT